MTSNMFGLQRLFHCLVFVKLVVKLIQRFVNVNCSVLLVSLGYFTQAIGSFIERSLGTRLI